MPSSAVGASRSIVSRSRVSLADSASNVVPMFTNRSAYVSATGAIWADVRPAWRKKLFSSVRSSDSVRATGSSFWRNGTRSSMIVLMSCPRPASALP